MTNILLSIYAFFERHTALLRVILIGIIAVCVYAISRISLVEDISSFLPASKENERVQYAYQHIGAANTLMVSVAADSLDEYAIIDAVDSFVEHLQSRDAGRIQDIRYQVEQGQIMDVGRFVIQNMPLYLSATDYENLERRMSFDSLVASLQSTKQMLLSPMGGFVKQFVTYDPLNIATLHLQTLTQSSSMTNYETIDGYIFDRSGREALVAIASKFPVSETSENARLITDIDSAMAETMREHEGVTLDCIGASVISLGNANRIKKDTVISTTIALVCILALLLYFFRDVRALLIITFSIAFGGLFGMAFVAVFQDSVSLIALGVGSIIVGIAVNYPLHFLAHYQQGYSKEQTIRDIIDPLVTGNLTTVGAFLSLVFIHSNAMNDLGLFASFLLIGTILFVLVFLPHLFKKKLFSKQERLSTNLVFNRIASYDIDRNKFVVATVFLLTIPLLILSTRTTFETNLHAINYMTDSQREKMAKMEEQTQNNKPSFFCVAEGSSVEAALQSYEKLLPHLDSLRQAGSVSGTLGIGTFIPSEKKQQEKIAQWNAFMHEHKDELVENLAKACAATGFTENAFAPFLEILSTEFAPHSIEYFSPIATSIGANFISIEQDGDTTERVLIYTIVESDTEHKQTAAERLDHIAADIFTFDNTSLVTQMVDALSEDFDSVLFICGLIVFCFLTFSFGRLELSLVAFVPLSVGWIWILGLMGLFDMKFNIVNIILATFIFGQGDDYTIFVTEGMMYEYTYRRKMLASYKNSVCLSAIIMFIGIGSLIVAQHPAMKSLGEVTIVGMFSVVLMAYLFPPLIYRWMTQKNGEYRQMPVTLRNLCTTAIAGITFLIGSIYLTLAGFFSLTVLGKTDAHKLWYHKRLCGIFRFLVKIVPQVDYEVRNRAGEDFEKPAVIIANHQSHLDLMYLLMLNPKIICLTNHWVWHCPFYGWIIRYADFYPVEKGIEHSVDILRSAVEKGYSVLVFPEGTRSETCDILRFHKGAFYLADQLGIDILPIVIHGIGHFFPKKEFLLRKGKATISVLDRITPSDPDFRGGKECRETTKLVRRMYIEEYASLARSVETCDYYFDLVLHNYIYKGRQIEKRARRVLADRESIIKTIDAMPDEGTFTIEHCGQGEIALLAALVKKDLHITATDPDADAIDIARNCVSVPGNLHYEVANEA